MVVKNERISDLANASVCAAWLARERPLYLPRQSIPLPQPHPTSRPRARRHRQPGTHSGAPGETANPPLPLGTAPSKRSSSPLKITHPAPQGGTTIPHQGRQMARPQADTRPGRKQPLHVRPHHPRGLGTVQEMPPPYRQGHVSGLVPNRNPTTTRTLANPQPRTPGHRTPLQGSPGQGSHHERGGDTGPTPTPRQTHGKRNGGSSAPPARSSPQSSGSNGTPQTPPVDTHGTTHRPQHQRTHAASHPLPCRAQPRRPLTHSAPHTRPSPASGPQDTTKAPQSPPVTQEATRQRPAQASQTRDIHTSTWTRRTPATHPARPPLTRSTPPQTDHHPRPRPPPSNPPRQGPEHSPGSVPPTRELDQGHRQSPPGPDHPRRRPLGYHRRPRTLASLAARPSPARLDFPHRVGPGPDTRQRHQRHTSRDLTPTTSPSGEGPASRPEPPGAMGTGHRTNPRHRPPRCRRPHPRRRPPSPTYGQ